jgi:integrase
MEICESRGEIGQRRSEMGVRIRQKNGVWYIFINHKGKRKAKRVGTDKRVALEAAKKIQARLALGEIPYQEPRCSNFTVREYGERWLKSYAKVQLRETTSKLYGQMLRNHVYPVIGTKALSEVSRDDIKTIIANMLSKGLSRSTVHGAIAPLREMFNHAIEDKLVLANPASRIGRFTKQKGDSRMRANPLSREELSLFLETARVNYPRYYPLLLCLARTGMRLGEALGLQWGDIDFQGRFIEIRRSYTHGKVVLPKNGKMRRVDMSIQLTETLKALSRERKEETLKKGWRDMPEWVFVNRDGGLLDGNNLYNRVFKKCLAKAGLRQVRIHDLRHTFASLLISQGESLAYVKDQLGHHSIKVTVDIYGHLVPGANKAAVDKLDELDLNQQEDVKAQERNLYATRSVEKVESLELTH